MLIIVRTWSFSQITGFGLAVSLSESLLVTFSKSLNLMEVELNAFKKVHCVLIISQETKENKSHNGAIFSYN